MDMKDIVLGKSRNSPLIVLFSPRERVRDILAVGLSQCEYRVIPADSGYLASIKANQFLPDLLIIDLTINNTRDVLVVTRLRRAIRTRGVSVLIVVPKDLRPLLEQTLNEMTTDKGLIYAIEYPFHFSELLSKVKTILWQSQTEKEKIALAEGKFPESNEAIARILLDSSQPVTTKFGAIESMLKQWSFPFIVVKALDIIESNASCCEQLSSCISADAGASAAVLKVSNTVQYAKRGKRVTDVQEAVVRLGFRETRNLLACLALIELSPELYKSYGFDRHEFWLHSLACALIAEKLCSDIHYRRPEIAFLAGLVHDLGKVPVDSNFSPVYAHLLEKTAGSAGAFWETEQEMMGFNHAELGHFLTNRWNFPDVISMALLNHHSPDRILAMSTPNDRIVHEAVYIANQCAKAMSIGHSCDEMLASIPQNMLADFKIPRGLSEDFFVAIYRGLNTMCKHLELSTRNLFISQPHPDHANQEVLFVLNNKQTFHPAILALRESGFTVKTANQFVPELYKNTRVLIHIPDKGTPLNITLFEEEALDQPKLLYLKIFLLDVLPEQKLLKNDGEAEIVFLDKNRLDIRMLLTVIDHFLGTVVVGQSQSIESLEPAIDGEDRA